MVYKRALLKISGEQLAGSQGGIDTDFVNWLANEVKTALAKTPCQLVIMVGAGNIVRGATTAGHGIKRVTADHMGMLGTLINALAVTDVFESQGIKTRCLSNVFASQISEAFSHRLAEKHLEKGRVVVLAGGSGRPFVTTDTAAVALALETDCDVVLKSTKVDGVYDKDPHHHEDATRFETLKYQSAVENSNIKIMDKAAIGLAMEQNMPVIVFRLDKSEPGNIAKVLAGEAVGTKIS